MCLRIGGIGKRNQTTKVSQWKKRGQTNLPKRSLCVGELKCRRVIGVKEYYLSFCVGKGCYLSCNNVGLLGYLSLWGGEVLQFKFQIKSLP